MVARIHRKNVLVMCDCIGCKNKPTWVQAFLVKKKVTIVDLCEEHHFILRTKVGNDIPLDENVLKWLLMQDANAHRVTKYGILRGPTDIEMSKRLREIELDTE